MQPRKFVPIPFTYHQELEVRIENLTNEGNGVARVDGWVVFVPFALPGELVKCRIYRNHKNYSNADLVEVLEPSAERVPTVCSLFGTCGGCHLSLPSGQLSDLRRDDMALQVCGNCSIFILPEEPKPQEAVAAADTAEPATKPRTRKSKVKETA